MARAPPYLAYITTTFFINSIIGDLPLHNYISCEQKVGQQFDKDGIGLLGRIGSFGAVITLALYVAAVMVSYV